MMCIKELSWLGGVLSLEDWSALMEVVYKGELALDDIAGYLVELGYDIANNVMEDLIKQKILETLRYLRDNGGYDLYLEVELNKCQKKRCGFFWCKTKWVWGESYNDYYKCNSWPYETIKGAMGDYGSCADRLKGEMENAKNGQKKIDDVFKYPE